MARHQQFGGFGGGANMQQLMRQAQKLQEQMTKAQEDIEAREFSAQVGGGMVSVTVNGKVARASYDVKVGDVIEIRFGAKTLRAEVLSVQETVKKDDAAAMYREL